MSLPGMALHETHSVRPLHDQCPSSGSVPVLFDIHVTARSDADPVMMAKTTLERLMSGPMQLTFVIHQKRAAVRRIFIVGKHRFIAPEGRGEYTKLIAGCYLQHHAFSVTGLEGVSSLFDRPPARTPAVALAYVAGAGRRGRILFRES